MSNFEESVDEMQLKKYDRYLSLLKKTDPAKLINFVETQYADAMMAGVGIDAKRQTMALRVRCPVLFYHSDADEVWPQKSEEGAPEQQYPSLTGSWDAYAPADRYET